MTTKFKMIFLALAVISFSMIGCSDDENDELEEITLNTSKVEVKTGESQIVNILTGNGDYTISSDDETIAVVAHEKGTEGFTVTGVKAGETHILVLDGKGKSDTLAVEVTMAGSLLEDGPDFTLVYTGSSQSDNRNINTTIGIKWFRNSVNTSTFRKHPADTANDFVLIDATQFNAITTKEELEAAYMAGAKESEYVAKQDRNFEQIYFISKVGDDYFKVNQKNLSTAGAGTTGSTADFSYQK